MQSPTTPATPTSSTPQGLSLLELSGAMSSRLIHDLTNQISSIVGNAEYAAYIAKGDERLTRTLEAIRNASDRAGKMLGQCGQLRRRLWEETSICSSTDLARLLSENLHTVGGWKGHIPSELRGRVRVHPEWFSRLIQQILLDSGSRAGRVDFAEGPLDHPWHWRGSGASASVFQVFLQYRSSQTLFGEDGPLQPEIAGTVAAWELMKSFRGQIHSRVTGPDQQEIAVLLPQI